MERKTFPFEIKGIDESGLMTGYASTFGNEDYDGDVVVKGAFKRTLDLKKGVVPFLWQHDTKSPIGWGIDGKEDSYGLDVTSQFLKNDPQAQKAREWAEMGLKLGAKVGLSIGYRAIKPVREKGVRFLKEVELLEYSLVTFPANAQATITGIKSVIPFFDFPVADVSRGWDAGAVRGRIKQWAGGDDIDWVKYRKAFLWCNPEELHDLKSYELPIADVIDGELVVIPKAITQALQTCDRLSATQEDREQVKANLVRYHAKRGGTVIEVKAITDFSSFLGTEQEKRSLWDRRWLGESALSSALCEINESEITTADQKKADCRNVRIQAANYQADLDAEEIDMDTAEDAIAAPSLEGKAGRSMSAATMSKLKVGQNMYSKAADLHTQGLAMHKQADGHMKNLMSGTAVEKSQEPGGKEEKGSDPEGFHSLMTLVKQINTKL